MSLDRVGGKVLKLHSQQVFFGDLFSMLIFIPFCYFLFIDLCLWMVLVSVDYVSCALYLHIMKYEFIYQKDEALVEINNIFSMDF